MAEREGFVHLRGQRYGGSHRVSEAIAPKLARDIPRERRRMAEREGFVHLRGQRYGGSHRVSEAIAPKLARDIPRERRRMAEREGFEPPCRLPGKTLSRRPRYDHFGTSPCSADAGRGTPRSPLGNFPFYYDSDLPDWRRSWKKPCITSRHSSASTPLDTSKR